MARGFGAEQYESEEMKRDTEVTLGPAMLLAIACGLLLLCGLFFMLGYRAGRSGSLPTSTVAAQKAAGQSPAVASSFAKPPARGFVPSAPAPQPAVVVPHATALEAPAQANALTSYALPGSNSIAGQPQVHPALTAAQPAGSAQAVPVPGAVYMVQVAVLARVDDASVLVNALRQRGYSVMTRREPSDHMIHVQVGPFANRSDAVAVGHRLLGDGYNAMVLP